MSGPGINLVLSDNGTPKTAVLSQQKNMPELTLFANPSEVTRFEMNQKNAGRAVKVSDVDGYCTDLADLHRSTI